jgi:hypothetical protein
VTTPGDAHRLEDYAVDCHRWTKHHSTSPRLVRCRLAATLPEEHNSAEMFARHHLTQLVHATGMIVGKLPRKNKNLKLPL